MKQIGIFLKQSFLTILAGIVLIGGLSSSVFCIYIYWTHIQANFFQLFNPFLSIQIIFEIISHSLFWVIAGLSGGSLLILKSLNSKTQKNIFERRNVFGLGIICIFAAIAIIHVHEGSWLGPTRSTASTSMVGKTPEMAAMSKMSGADAAEAMNIIKDVMVHSERANKENKTGLFKIFTKNGMTSKESIDAFAYTIVLPLIEGNILIWKDAQKAFALRQPVKSLDRAKNEQQLLGMGGDPKEIAIGDEIVAMSAAHRPTIDKDGKRIETTSESIEAMLDKCILAKSVAMRFILGDSYAAKNP